MTERTKEEIEKEITNILEQYVAPFVAQHGGSVNYKDYNNGVVLLEMSGACSGCAGSTATLKHGIQNLLIEMVPEVASVEGIDDPYSNVAPYLMSPYLMEDYIDVMGNEGMLGDPNNE